METAVRTPLDVFNLPQHLVVPLFQRPYVWDEENQWVPLWQDVRRLADLRLENPMSVATHFLGAVVLQGQDNQTGTVPSRKHTNRDRESYAEVMRADPPIAYTELTHGTSLLALGHKFFSEQVEHWLGDDSFPEFAIRAETLTNVITRALQLVVIDLRPDENSQEIFETLNARGTPLTAADLIKNFVFQRLAADGVDAGRTYAEYWPFDSSFWEKEVAVGRYFVSRSSLFLNQWLVSRLGEEISPRQTFTRFKHFVEHEAGVSMAALLPLLNQQAALYQRWNERAADPHADLNRVELSVYRLQATELELLKPILI